MAVLRTWADVEAYDGGPTTAEWKLIKACKAGQRCVLGHGTRPDGPSDAHTIRADILRYLLLGGCETCPVDGRGTRLIGAYITGDLNLNFSVAHGATGLENCHFANRFKSVQTRFVIVNLSGSKLNGWMTQGAKVEGGVFLRDSESDGLLDFNGISIGGLLICEGARLRATDGYAMSAYDARITGAIILHPRTERERQNIERPFHSTGELRLNGATIGGLYANGTTLVATSTGQTLSLGGATVNGSVRLDGCSSTGEMLIAGSRISGRLTCERMTLANDNGHAFNAQAVRVDHAFVWKKVNHVSGAISLNGAHVAELNDDPENWPDRDNLFLDGFTYDRIKGTVSTSPARMDWLKAGSYFGDEFRPQPYSQYAKFLRDTGHDEDARRVLYTRERLRRASAREQLRASGDTFAGPKNLWSLFWGFLLRMVVGYGHYPFRSVAALAVLITLAILPAHFAWEEGSFAPNAAPVAVSDAWTEFARTEDKPAAVWAGDVVPKGSTMTPPEWRAMAPGRDWETFNRYAYGFDVVIPIIDFGQTDAWAPSTTRGPIGWHLWWARWVLSVMGWIVTALGAAAITGIIRRE